MTNIKAVVFDLYDTLIYIDRRTNPYLHLFEDLHLSSEEIKNARRIAVTQNFDSLLDYVQAIKPGVDIDFSLYTVEIAKENASTRLFPETKKVLGELKKRKIKIGLISNLASPYKSPFYEFGLEKYFDEIVFSCDVGFRKPEKETYQIMINRLQINPSGVIMTGDKVFADVDGPKAVGMNAVHLDRKNNSPGSISTLEGIFKFL